MRQTACLTERDTGTLYCHLPLAAGSHPTSNTKVSYLHKPIDVYNSANANYILWNDEIFHFTCIRLACCRAVTWTESLNLLLAAAWLLYRLDLFYIQSNSSMVWTHRWRNTTESLAHSAGYSSSTQTGSATCCISLPLSHTNTLPTSEMPHVCFFFFSPVSSVSMASWSLQVRLKTKWSALLITCMLVYCSHVSLLLKFSCTLFSFLQSGT